MIFLVEGLSVLIDIFPFSLLTANSIIYPVAIPAP